MDKRASSSNKALTSPKTSNIHCIDIIQQIYAPHCRFHTPNLSTEVCFFSTINCKMMQDDTTHLIAVNWHFYDKFHQGLQGIYHTCQCGTTYLTLNTLAHTEQLNPVTYDSHNAESHGYYCRLLRHT